MKVGKSLPYHIDSQKITLVHKYLFILEEIGTGGIGGRQGDRKQTDRMEEKVNIWIYKK